MRGHQVSASHHSTAWLLLAILYSSYPFSYEGGVPIVVSKSSKLTVSLQAATRISDLPSEPLIKRLGSTEEWPDERFLSDRANAIESQNLDTPGAPVRLQGVLFVAFTIVSRFPL